MAGGLLFFRRIRGKAGSRGLEGRGLRQRCFLSLPAQMLCLTLGGLLLLDLASPLLNGQNDVGAILAEALAVQTLNEFRQRRLPGFLTMVVELAELRGVHAHLA